MQYPEGSFGYDLNFLRQYDDVAVLRSGDEKAQIIVSPKYQGKVFTSTADGYDGYSFGWVNYSAFDAPVDEHMNAYGGENRLWLGPEGGKFSLYFKPGDRMEFANWRTPAPFDTEPWTMISRTKAAVVMQKDMELRNYHGTLLSLTVRRTVEILDEDQIRADTGMTAGAGVRVVGYRTMNGLKNTGKEAWTAEAGMPCIWMLDMMKNTPSTVVVVPFRHAAGRSFAEVATTNYFGEIPAGRLKHDDDKLYFKADGNSRGKLGIKPAFAKPVLGSYDAINKVLTITIFKPDPAAQYLNQEWNTTQPPFSGDAVNAYNDGPLEDGTQMGPFYEIESVSPAAFLAAGEEMIHHHAVYHFTGDEELLDIISQKMLGVTINDIKKAF